MDHSLSQEANFPPIGDYALLSDCENTCLVAPTGAVEWLCLPRPHDASVFGSLLDRGAGSFRLSPSDRAVPSHRQYVPGTMVLETTWQSATGWLVVRDFLDIRPWFHDRERSPSYRRTPRDHDAGHLLVRMATCLYGSLDVDIECEPAFDYGAEDGVWEYGTVGYNVVRTGNSGQPPLILTGDVRFGIEGRVATARRHLSEGESFFVALGWTGDDPPLDSGEVLDRLNRTLRFWRSWIDGGRFPDHPWRELLQRSALTLKGLSYAPSGAILAAPTTSLPEVVGGTRNWDYRYTWVRDSAFALRALRALGFDTEADDFLAFLADALEPPERSSPRRDLRVLYPVDGEESAAEVTLEHLSGYAGSRPVRTGNAARDQVQHDIFGALVDCVFEHTRTRDSLSERSWRIVIQAADTALACWDQPDRGIWEIRSEPQHFTFSKVMCWVALDRAGRLAALRGDRERAERWSDGAAMVHDEICRRGVNEHGVFTATFGGTNLDASLLLLPMVGFLPPDDPRLRDTVNAIADHLADGAFVSRYRPEETDDGLDGQREGSFTVCSFWLVSALAITGEVARARAHCERLIAASSSLGLYAEEIDPQTGRHLGNFPQALTHLAMINALLRVINAERREPATSWTAGATSWWDAGGKEARLLEDVAAEDLDEATGRYDQM